MPRPIKGGALILLSSGAREFRIGDWWSSLKEAKLFLPLGFSEVMALLGLVSVEPLMEFTAQACAVIESETDWTKIYKVKTHWIECARERLTDAAEVRPMLFAKAMIAIETLWLYAQSIGSKVDPYKKIKLIPAAYRLDGWADADYKAHKEGNTAEYIAFKKRALALGQRKPDLILQDLAAGKHGTWELLSLAKEVFVGLELEIETAKRVGKHGVFPASSFIVARYPKSKP